MQHKAKGENAMSLRAIVTVLCGSLLVLLAATNLGASEAKGPFSVAQASNAQAVPPGHYTCKYNVKLKRCGGTCPEGSVCKKHGPTPISCGCVPVPKPCVFDKKTKTCGGSCPPNKTCQQSSSNKCGCK